MMDECLVIRGGNGWLILKIVSFIVLLFLQRRMRKAILEI